MQIFLIFVVLISLHCICIESILNGSFITILDAPYYVALIDENDERICGGAIISENWVVTAAHCAEFTVKVRTAVTVNHNKGLIYEIEKIITHGDFELLPHAIADSDISLIKLTKPIQFNEFQQPIKIASNPPKVGDMLTISGLGFQGKARDDPPSLKKIQIPVLEQEYCRQQLAPDYPTNNTFCAGDGRSSVCTGDSGSASVIDGKLVAVVSWATECNDEIENKGKPNVFTRLHNFYDWIINHTGLKYQDS